jgi:hypothetical protein
MAVYVDIFSATDADVFVQMILPSGALSGGAFVDQTTASWAGPRIADLASAQTFLVVAEITRVTPHYVRGRIVEPNGTIVTLGSQFDVAYQGSPGNEKIRPDVGGDPTADPSSTWCVCFQESFPTPAGEIEIACRASRGTGRCSGRCRPTSRRAAVRRSSRPTLDLEVERRRRLARRVAAGGIDLRRRDPRAVHPQGRDARRRTPSTSRRATRERLPTLRLEPARGQRTFVHLLHSLPERSTSGSDIAARGAGGRDRAPGREPEHDAGSRGHARPGRG